VLDVVAHRGGRLHQLRDYQLLALKASGVYA
jgi:hypothetical protein